VRLGLTMKQTIYFLLAALTASVAFAKPANLRRRHIVMLPAYTVVETHYNVAADAAAQLTELRQKANLPLALPAIPLPRLDEIGLAPATPVTSPASAETTSSKPGAEQRR